MSSKIPPLELGTAILVTWDDAGSPNTQHWLSPDEVIEMDHITSLGYFMKQTKRYFTLASTLTTSHDGKPEYGGPFSIPCGCVRKVVKL